MKHADLLGLLLPPVSYAPAETHLAASLAAHGSALDRAMADGVAVMDGVTPYGRLELLPDWERVYGLADKASHRMLQERVAALMQRINEQGGTSREYYIVAALSVGFSVSITEFNPSTVESSVGMPLYGDDWMYAWQVNAPETTMVSFRPERSAVGEPLAKWENELLESTLRNLVPAHTVLLFSYGGNPSLLLHEDGDGFLMTEDNEYLDMS